MRAGMQACACRRRRRRRRAYGGGRASIGVRACLRFVGVSDRPVKELEGGFQGRLFVGKVSMAKREERAFKRLFCALGKRIGKRGAKGWKGAKPGA